MTLSDCAVVVFGCEVNHLSYYGNHLSYCGNLFAGIILK